jgi:hypothetical protein
VQRRLSEGARERLRAACQLLIEVIDAPTGHVPNHGGNDGAWVHPVALADDRDFRPSLTAACAAFGQALPADVQPNEEVLAWIRRAAPARVAAREDGVRTGASGWAVARVRGTMVFLRAGRYTSRPGHADPLQLDIRIGGREIVVDPGTFAYAAPSPWRNGLVGARVHNGPLLDGNASGVQGPRFLWLEWPDSEITEVNFDGAVAKLVARSPGKVKRTVMVAADEVRVIDERLDPSASQLTVCWLLHPDASPDWVTTTGPARVIEAREGDVSAWYSPRYAQRIASRAVVVESGREAVTTFALTPSAER